MDTLVARYSQPLYETEGYSQREQQELTESLPRLTLNFTLPPIARVCLTYPPLTPFCPQSNNTDGSCPA
jgi:hypothetical protein